MILISSTSKAEKGLGSIQWGRGKRDSVRRGRQGQICLSFLLLFSHTPSYLLFFTSLPCFVFFLFSSPSLLSHSVHLHSITPPPTSHSHHHAFLRYSLGSRHRSPHRPARRCSCPHGQGCRLPQRCYPLLLCHLEVQTDSTQHLSITTDTSYNSKQYRTNTRPHVHQHIALLIRGSRMNDPRAADLSLQLTKAIDSRELWDVSIAYR